MFGIGDFARLGRVSVRMLRHYDAVGLLPPARVDPATGYRSYGADQLPRLNRIVALKDLGFTLAQVAELLDERVDVEQLRGMLRLRRAQLAEQVAADTARLAEVAARLRAIEQAGRMPDHDVVVKPVPAVVVAELTGTAASYQFADINPVVAPLYDAVFGRLAAAGVAPAGPHIAYYEDIGDGIRVHAAVPVAEPAPPALDIVELPAVPHAATLLHHGDLAGIGPAFDAIAHWLAGTPHTPAGGAREVYLDWTDADATVLIELQVPIAVRAR